MPGARPREVTEREQPALFALLRATAARAGAPLPGRVVLLAEVNASIGGDELGLGLGLLSVHSAGELSAAVAHELGHGPRPRGLAAAGLRLAPGLAEHLARRRELRADEAAVRAAGREVHLAALEAAARGAALFDQFLQDEVAPLLGSGRRPDNLYDGFRAYADELAASPAQSPAPGAALAERLAHARALPEPPGAPPPADRRPARSLLVNAERLERELSLALAEALAPGAALAPIGWLDAAEQVWAPRLAEEARLVAMHLAATLGCAPTARAALAALVRALEGGDEAGAATALEPVLAALPPARRVAATGEVLARALGALLGAALVERGWRWRAEPGRPLELARDGATLAPFPEALLALADRPRLARLLARAGTAA
jgi:hypothetical protein